MPKIAINHPAMIDDDVATLRKPFDREQRAVAEFVLAILRLSSHRHSNAVTDGQGELRRVIKLETIGQLDGAVAPSPMISRAPLL